MFDYVYDALVESFYHASIILLSQIDILYQQANHNLPF